MKRGYIKMLSASWTNAFPREIFFLGGGGETQKKTKQKQKKLKERQAFTCQNNDCIRPEFKHIKSVAGFENGTESW